MTPAETPTECEALASIEHDQWIAWSKDLASKETLSPERLARWRSLWVPYEELSEEMKEHDRRWARLVQLVTGRSIAEKDARIRELEESRKQLADAVERLLDCDLGRVDEPPGIIENTEHGAEVDSAIAEARAALARSSEVPK